MLLVKKTATFLYEQCVLIYHNPIIVQEVIIVMSMRTNSVFSFNDYFEQNKTKK